MNNSRDIDMLKTNCSRYFWVFVGQNAYIGKAHPLTGNMSYYGSFLCFKHHDDAKRYVREFKSDNYREFAKLGTINTLRKYALGISWFNYLSNLVYTDCLTYDENGELQ